MFSGLDLCLHVLRNDLGVDAARLVAQELVAAPFRDGHQAQFIARPLDVAEAGPIADLCAWIKLHPQAQLALADMTARCAVSPRTFTRHFRQATGPTPLQRLLTLRLDEARRLLERTELSIDEVAERCGLSTSLSLRTHFRRRLDTTRRPIAETSAPAAEVCERKPRAAVSVVAPVWQRRQRLHRRQLGASPGGMERRRIPLSAACPNSTPYRGSLRDRIVRRPSCNGSTE
jgi:AraC-like DNA-binding protein